MGLDMNLYSAPRYGTLTQVIELYDKLSENEYAYRELLEEYNGNQSLMVTQVLDQKKDILANSGIPEDFQKIIGSAGSLIVELAYWRKFNALHAWFVRNCQGGIDECQKSEVTKEKLSILLEVLMYAYGSKDPSGFMPVSGFFFGHTEVNDDYWEQVDSAIRELTTIYENFDFEKNILFYQASW